MYCCPFAGGPGCGDSVGVECRVECRGRLISSPGLCIADQHVIPPGYLIFLGFLLLQSHRRAFQISVL